MIFRDGRRQTTPAHLVRKLRDELRLLPVHPGNETVLSLLLRAGELECALHDAGLAGAESAAQLTDVLAGAAVAGEVNGEWLTSTGLRLLGAVPSEGSVSISTPEGFAYYALHPLDYADLAKNVCDESIALIIGIRSIGATLSAIVAAKLRTLGTSCIRTTVRPTGHPYARRCEFEPQQRQLIRSAARRNAVFLVCDEGPGRSGSSFLSVAESLERERVAAERITLLCSHEPDLKDLCAKNAPKRWSRYGGLYSGLTRRLPCDAEVYLGGGAWRRELLPPSEQRPSSWPAMERLKYLTGDRRHFLKFEGYGPYGTPVRSRNQALAESGFGAPYVGDAVGFGRHLMLPGRIGCVADITAQLLTRMARYCAWRVREFATTDATAGHLQNMVTTNFECDFVAPPPKFNLALQRPVIADGRMLPHEWFLTPEGTWFKLDAATHGDDHFFPGPCDIAWDLAGVTVEWQLNRDAREFFLSEYQHWSGDDASHRLASYELAYATFRFAWTRMAAASVRATQDEHRLLREYRRYREAAWAIADANLPIFRRTKLASAEMNPASL